MFAGGHSCAGKYGAVGCDQIELDGQRRRRVAWRLHREPRKPIGIVFSGSERVVRAVEPLAGIRKLRMKLFRDVGADFVTATADAGTKRGDHIFRPRAKFHLHAAQSFFSDATHGAAPAGVYGSHGMIFCVGEQNRDAIGGLHDEKHAGFASDQRVPLQWLYRCETRPLCRRDARYRSESGAARRPAS